MSYMEKYILQSKERCQQLGLDPETIPILKIFDSDHLDQILKEYEEILSVVNFFVNKLLSSVKGTPVLILITDDKGTVLEVAGDATVKSLMQQLGFKAGVQFAEKYHGTNAVSLALEYKCPIRLVGTDHYHNFFQNSACFAMPFQYTELGNILGTLTIMTSREQANDLFLSLLVTVVDSIERELALRRQYKKINVLNQIMIDATNTGIIVTDAKGEITEFNNYAEKLIGINREKLLGRSVKKIKILGKHIHNILKSQKVQEDIELVIEDLENHTKTVCLFDGMPIYDDAARVIGAFGKFRDITERFKEEERISYMAHHDDLTGLPNRRRFHEVLANELAEAKRDKSMLALMLLDLDQFKLVNDTLGHSQGDIVLIEVAKRLRKMVGSHGSVCRMGGDEFTIVMPRINVADEAIRLAKAIIEGLSKRSYKIGEYEFDISASLGISYYPNDGDDATSLLIHADTSMFSAKEQGRNSYRVYSSGMNKDSYERLTLQKALSKAISNNELVLHYQPQVDLTTNRIIGVEALIRWNHPEKGLMSPTQFIPLAEQTGIIVSIEEWVIKTACQQNKQWQDLGLPLIKVAVNLSSHQFIRYSLIDTIKRILNETGIMPEHLELEITESMTMDVEKTIPILHALNQLGIHVSIDDFGTGYSSLSYLKDFAIHCLKIDQSFIRNMINDPKGRNIVKTIIAMAQGLELEVVAEGVETEQEADLLRAMNCQFAQGYFFFKPLLPTEVERLLALTAVAVNK